MIKNDILIQRQDALSEQINTSSEAIYLYGPSIIWVEVGHVSAPGFCSSHGSFGVTRSALMSSEGETLTGDPHWKTAPVNRRKRSRWVPNYVASCSGSSHMCVCEVEDSLS